MPCGLFHCLFSQMTLHDILLPGNKSPTDIPVGCFSYQYRLLWDFWQTSSNTLSAEYKDKLPVAINK